MIRIAPLVFLTAAAAMAADQGPAIGKTFDQQLKMIEGEVVSLAEAMPADKYNFAPTQGAFTKAHITQNLGKCRQKCRAIAKFKLLRALLYLLPSSR